MPPTKLNPTSRYIHAEVATVYGIDTVAAPDTTGPTRVEIDAGTDWTDEVAEMTGWALSAQRVAVPDLGRKFVSQVGGRINPSDSSIMFWASEDTLDIRDAIATGDKLYVMIAHGGDVTGQKADLWYVEVNAISKPIVVGNESPRITVEFAHLARPLEDFAIPA